jgi:hypothetical protein
MERTIKQKILPGYEDYTGSSKELRMHPGDTNHVIPNISMSSVLKTGYHGACDVTTVAPLNSQLSRVVTVLQNACPASANLHNVSIGNAAGNAEDRRCTSHHVVPV